MATFTRDPRGFGQLLRSLAVQRGCVRAAGPEAARIRSATPRSDISEPGYLHTADTTRVEPADFGDRLGAVIVQEGAAVAVNFGNSRVRGQHYVNRGR